MNQGLMAETLCKGKSVYLRPLGLADVTERYCGWLNSKETVMFLECRFQHHTMESVKDFVRNEIANEAVHFMAIIQMEDDRHIGNIKMGPVDGRNHLADIGILIGDEDCRGKSYGTEAIRLMTRYAFAGLQLHKLTAGCYAKNTASLRAFAKAGFELECVRKAHCLREGTFEDVCLLGLINPDFRLPGPGNGKKT